MCVNVPEAGPPRFIDEGGSVKDNLEDVKSKTSDDTPEHRHGVFLVLVFFGPSEDSKRALCAFIPSLTRMYYHWFSNCLVECNLTSRSTYCGVLSIKYRQKSIQTIKSNCTVSFGKLTSISL
jgi:hypothetical protein